MTVDRSLRYQPTRCADLAGDDARWVPLTLPWCPRRLPVLVELKYGERPPAWMDTLIRTLAPARVSYSKYVAAMASHAAATLVTRHVQCDLSRSYQTVGARS